MSTEMTKVDSGMGDAPVDQGETGKWYREAVIYQIYVPSFKDTNGDGYGDIRGVIEKLDYLHNLGVNVIWLSPICDSPFFDMGYDTSDYRGIGAKSGTMKDLQELIWLVHSKGMKILMDIALNHSSIEHEWFKASRLAQSGVGDISKKDYYIWRDGKLDSDGKEIPPNNWESVFIGSMWQWDDVARKYYLHIFGTVQADLNWDCPELREEVYEILRFWLDKGVDGFRLDAINLVSKVPGLPDAPIIDPSRHIQKANDFFANGPRVHEYLQEMYEKIFARYDCVALGEMSCGITTQQAIDYLSPPNGKKEIDLLIQFNHIELDCIDGDKWILRDWELKEFKDVISMWQHTTADIGAWNTVWMENHDQPRAISRFTKPTPVLREYAAKLIALHMLTLRGTTLIYQGQELGLANPEEFDEGMIRDVETVIFWDNLDHDAQDEDSLAAVAKAKHAIQVKGRDAGRVPMPWDNTMHGGFTSPEVTPWIPAMKDGPSWIAEAECKDPRSVYNFYKEAIAIRKNNKTLASLPMACALLFPIILLTCLQLYGKYEEVDPESQEVFAYLRRSDEGVFLVVLSFMTRDVAWMLPGDPMTWELRLCTYPAGIGLREVSNMLTLRPYEGRLYELREPLLWSK